MSSVKQAALNWIDRSEGLIIERRNFKPDKRNKNRLPEWVDETRMMRKEYYDLFEKYSHTCSGDRKKGRGSLHGRWLKSSQSQRGKLG